MNLATHSPYLNTVNSNFLQRVTFKISWKQKKTKKPKNKSYLALVMTFLAAKLQGSLSELSQIIAAKTIKKKSIMLTDSDVQTLLGFGNDISCG